MPDETRADTPTATANIFISRNNQTHGPYPRDVIENWINTGKINRYDLACTEKRLGNPSQSCSGLTDLRKLQAASPGNNGLLIIAIIAGVVVFGALANNSDNQQKSSATSGSATNSTTSKDQMADIDKSAKNRRRD